MMLPSDCCEWCSWVGLEDEGHSCPCLSAYGFYPPGALIPPLLCPPWLPFPHIFHPPGSLCSPGCPILLREMWKSTNKDITARQEKLWARWGGSQLIRDHWPLILSLETGRAGWSPFTSESWRSGHDTSGNRNRCWHSFHADSLFCAGILLFLSHLLTEGRACVMIHQLIRRK